MTAPRLTSDFLVGAICRIAQDEGGFPAVFAKGDERAGAILLSLRKKGSFAGLLERMPVADEHYEWQSVGPQAIENEQEFTEYCNRRRARDPDLWVVELDIPDVERFIVRLSSFA